MTFSTCTPKEQSSAHTLVRLFADRAHSLRHLPFISWLRLALVFTIVTSGLLVAFFGSTVRVEAATRTRFTPATPPPPLGGTPQ